MQHKISDTWKCAYNTEYPAMAEEGLVDTTTMTNVPSPNNNSNSCNTIATERTAESASPPMTNGKFSPGGRDGIVKLEKGMRGECELEMNGLGRGREPSGLEQKIQELRAEKEAYEMHMSSPGDGAMNMHRDVCIKEEAENRESHQSQDTPLDFSVKRRASSFSGSVTDESRASSSSPSHGTADYRGGSLLTVSPSPEPVSTMDGRDPVSADGRLSEDVKGCLKMGAGSGHDIHQQFHHHLHPNFMNHRRDGTPSPESHSKIKMERESDTINFGESDVKAKLEVGEQPDNSENQQSHQQVHLPGLSPPSASSLAPPLLNSLGGLFPGLNPSFLAGKSAMGAFSQMAAAAAFMDPRNVGLNTNNSSNGGGSNNSNANNKKTTRPFKAYPKEALQMPLGGFFGAPGLSPSLLQQGIESGMFAGMNTDDLMTLYNQQLQLLRDKQVSSSTPTPPQGHKLSTSPSLSPRLTNGSTDSQHENHLHHQQHSKYRNHQQGPQHSPPHHLPSNHHFMPMNPSSNNILTSQHHHNNNNGSPPAVENSSQHHSNSPYHAPASTLVSSTSPSPASSSNHGGNSNSRKRPRSLPDEQKDAAYWERRRKNNDAAKRSRDARRAKEDEIALRAALLEQENIKLRVEVASLKTETSRLRCLLYNS
ncbi:thyrotroph embryonic factor [Elysia marginata]|uniref:Thyrotroph embryonic factor n=1 Tax=Elysia marginata TaxID=1093978 RepID=A0AAV4IP96_9GAST|nr:thyrotroph embryonic factor [Elysia marginata]